MHLRNSKVTSTKATNNLLLSQLGILKNNKRLEYSTFKWWDRTNKSRNWQQGTFPIVAPSLHLQPTLLLNPLMLCQESLIQKYMGNWNHCQRSDPVSTYHTIVNTRIDQSTIHWIFWKRSWTNWHQYWKMGLLLKTKALSCLPHVFKEALWLKVRDFSWWTKELRCLARPSDMVLDLLWSCRIELFILLRSVRKKYPSLTNSNRLLEDCRKLQNKTWCLRVKRKTKEMLAKKVGRQFLWM